MNSLGLLIAVLIVHEIHAITVDRRVVAYINVFRHLHGVPPIVLHPLIAQEAKLAAASYAKTGSKANAQNAKYNANYCTYSGLESELAQTCAVMWYTTVSHHVWCYPKATGPASPFVNMLWVPSINVGIGVAKNSAGKVFVVAFFSPGGDQKVGKNVPPVRVVKEASPKAKCPTGFTRFGTSCFSYHSTQLSWQDALVHCAKQNATLLSVRDSEEEKFVRGLQKKNSANSYTWIGLRDKFQEGRYSWIDGLMFGARSCVPINAGGGYLENCAAWSTNKPIGCWSDRVCSEKLPFTCRKPVEGRASYRVEILFKRQKWHPKLADPKSKTFKDFATGLVVTLKEIFTRARSGKKAKGFRKVNVKALRPLKYNQQKPPGVAVLLSIKFRSLNSDPTLKFQNFLRPSEKLLHMSLEIPGISHRLRRVSNANFCAGACHAHYSQAQAYCNNPYTLQQVQSSYCPLGCTSTQSSTCPSYCHQSCCSATSSTQTTSQSATYPASTATSSPQTTSQPVPYPATSAYPSTYPDPYAYPASAPSSVQYAPSVDYQGTTVTSSYCPSTCYQADPSCLTYCDEECCQENPTQKHLEKLITKMKANIARIRGLLGSVQNVSEPLGDELSGLGSGSGENSIRDSDEDTACSLHCLKNPSNTCSKTCSDSCCANLLRQDSINLVRSMKAQLSVLEEKYHDTKAHSKIDLSKKFKPYSEIHNESPAYDGPVKSSDEFSAYVEQPITDVNYVEEQNRLAESLEKENALQNEDINQVYATPSDVGPPDNTESANTFGFAKQKETYGQQGFEGQIPSIEETVKHTTSSLQSDNYPARPQQENRVFGRKQNSEAQNQLYNQNDLAMFQNPPADNDLSKETFVGIAGLNSTVSEQKENLENLSNATISNQIEAELSSQAIVDENAKRKSGIIKNTKVQIKQVVNRVGNQDKNMKKETSKTVRKNLD